MLSTLAMLGTTLARWRSYVCSGHPRTDRRVLAAAWRSAPLLCFAIILGCRSALEDASPPAATDAAPFRTTPQGDQSVDRFKQASGSVESKREKRTLASPLPGTSTDISFINETTTQFRAVVPRMPGAGSATFANVLLPYAASGAVVIEDEATKHHVRFSLRGASDASAVAKSGVVTYRGAYHGSDIIQRVGAEGTEDFVKFEAPPEREELVYDVDVSEVAGLRLVSNVLEFLDEGGAPRVRINPPFVVDRTSERSAARIVVDDCDFSSDPSAPWGKHVRSPGRRTCTVKVQWHVDRYPAVVDPSWTATGNMVVARTRHASVRLPSGLVLVAGGNFSIAELYNEATSSFATTGESGSLDNSSGEPLASGKALVVGTLTRIYDPVTGLFGPTGARTTTGVETALLPSGKVLVAGASAELFDPITNSFQRTGTMRNTGKVSLARLKDGRVLAIGRAGAEIYDPMANAFVFSPVIGAPGPNDEPPVSAVLPSGEILIVRSAGTSEIFDPVRDAVVPGPPFVEPRSLAANLPSGLVLFCGGIGKQGMDAVRDCALYGDGRFVASAPMKFVRRDYRATVLQSGHVLVTGGDINIYASPTNTAELYTATATGKACALAADCEYGFCVDGVCCNDACQGQCQACDVAGSVGKCAPVIGQPHGTRAGCIAGGTPCGGACDGKSVSSCIVPAGDTPCNEGCSDAQVRTDVCDGTGSCVARAPRRCDGNLVCASALSCKARCENNADCTKGSSCSADGKCTSELSCANDHISQNGAGVQEDCGGYRCDPLLGSCRNQCNSVDDCFAPATCDPSGACIAKDSAASSGCAIGGGYQRPGGGLLVAALGLLFARRIRRKSEQN